jgi:hypothetical protein
MPTKSTTSIKTTTNLNTGKIKSFRTTYQTKTSGNFGKSGLTQLGRAGTIFITILAISVGSAVSIFTLEDLNETTPNYQVINDFVPIDDPMTDINYLEYGDGVVDNLMDFINGFSAVGEFAYAGVYTVVRFFQNPVMFVLNAEPDDPNLNVFNWQTKANRILTNIEDAQEWYAELTLGNQLLYEMEIYPSIFILAKWMYYSPAQLTD